MQSCSFLPCALAAVLLLAARSLPAAPKAVPVESYETSAVLQAGEILQPEFLAGPQFKVRQSVTTGVGINEYVIDSDYGVFIAHGNSLLEERVGEIGALAKLDAMSKSKEFGEALKQAAKTPLVVAENLIDDPGETLKQAGRGVGKFLQRIGRGVKEATDGRPRSEYEDDKVKSVLGVSSAKRDLCRKLQINPYSTNEVLQQKLNDMSWTLFAGKLAVTAATLPIGGGAGAAISGTKFIGHMDGLVYDQGPSDLRMSNLKALLAMGVPKPDAEAFLAARAFSPWHQTRFVSALQSMPDVEGREVLVRDATSASETEADAIFYAETARLMARFHTAKWKIARITLLNGVPVCVLQDGSLLLALHWDYARWTPQAERLSGALQGMQLAGGKPPGISVALTGAATPRLKQEVEAAGIRLYDRLDKGPLK